MTLKKQFLSLSLAVLLCLFGFSSIALGQEKAKTEALKVVFIRHGEKPKKGNNLTCEGFNRSLQLPNVLFAKFGIPSNIYIPALALGEQTKHARMFETLIPFAVKYNLLLNSSFEEKDADKIAADIKSKSGTVLVCWEHKAIINIVNSLGYENDVKWGDDDYDSIWIVTFKDGVARFSQESEGIKPSSVCPF